MKELKIYTYPECSALAGRVVVLDRDQEPESHHDLYAVGTPEMIIASAQADLRSTSNLFRRRRARNVLEHLGQAIVEQTISIRSIDLGFDPRNVDGPGRVIEIPQDIDAVYCDERPHHGYVHPRPLPIRGSITQIISSLRQLGYSVILKGRR